MSTRTTLRPNTVISAGDMSAATVTSTATILQSITSLNYAVTWSGTTPIGVLAVQASDDYKADGGTVLNAGTWNVVPLNLAGASVTSIPITGNTGNGMIDIDGIAAYAVRLLYTKTSGVGTLVAVVTGKVS
ncbi:MAG: hypothetical protein V4641_09970 [Pseudomonadota bacterium]